MFFVKTYNNGKLHNIGTKANCRKKRYQKLPKYVKRKVIKTLDESEHILENLLQNGLEQIARMRNLSENELKQITKLKNLSQNELEQIAKTRHIKNYKNMKLQKKNY